MSTTKQISVNYTDTPIPDVTSLTLKRGLVNFGKDFKIQSDTSNEVILTNLTAPITEPEKFRWAFTDIADIYKGTAIESSVRFPTKRGVNILCQLNDTWHVSDTVDPTFNAVIPVSAHLVLKVPACEAITPEQIETLVGRLVSGLYETGVTDKTRLASLLRGSLKPSDV